jgi:hypothetical protein
MTVSQLMSLVLIAVGGLILGLLWARARKTKRTAV